MAISFAPLMGTALFPPQATALESQALAEASANPDLTAHLGRGHILYQIQEQQGFEMPRLVTLWSLPIPMQPVIAAMRDVDRWADWMPRFSASTKRPAAEPRSYYQEAKMKAAGMTIHYQVLVHERVLDRGLQLYWGLDKTGFSKNMLAMGLAINNGSFAIYPITENESLVAYSIHTQVAPLVPGTKGKITKATVEELPQFPGSLASRAVDPQWTSRSHPRFRPFTMQEVK